MAKHQNRECKDVEEVPLLSVSPLSSVTRFFFPGILNSTPSVEDMVQHFQT